MTTADPTIYTFTDPELTLDGKDVRCISTHFGWAADTTTTDVTTFCGVQTLSGQTNYTLNVTLLASFGDGGAFDVLGACAGLSDPVEWTLKPFRGQPVSAENPQWSGMATPQPYSFEADAGGTVEITLAWNTTKPECTTTPASNGSLSAPLASSAA